MKDVKYVHIIPDDKFDKEFIEFINKNRNNISLLSILWKNTFSAFFINLYNSPKNVNNSKGIFKILIIKLL